MTGKGSISVSERRHLVPLLLAGGACLLMLGAREHKDSVKRRAAPTKTAQGEASGRSLVASHHATKSWAEVEAGRLAGLPAPGESLLGLEVSDAGPSAVPRRPAATPMELDVRWGSERQDQLWTQQLRERAHRVMEDFGLPGGVVKEVSCRTTVCRMTFGLESLAELLAARDTVVSEGQRLTLDMDTASGQAVAYVAREGMEDEVLGTEEPADRRAPLVEAP